MSIGLEDRVMSDVLEIARKKREKLKAEITYLEAFIRMGEKISKESGTVAMSEEAPSRGGLADRLEAMRLPAAE